MTQITLEVGRDGSLILPKGIVEEATGTRMTARKKQGYITVRLENEATETEQKMPLDNELEVIRANVINGVLAVEMWTRFQSFFETRGYSKTWFDTAIIRSCTQAAILSTARIFDSHKDATALPNFLRTAELRAHEFPRAKAQQVKQTVCLHREKIANDKVVPAIKHFRDTQWAHPDTREAINHFKTCTEKVLDDYSLNTYSPKPTTNTIQEEEKQEEEKQEEEKLDFAMWQVHALLEWSREAADIYSEFLGLHPLTLTDLRRDIDKQFSNYIDFRLQARSFST